MAQATLIIASERWQRLTPTARIDAIVRAQGRSISWLAQQLGMSKQLFHTRLHGLRSWRAAERERVAKALGVPVYCIWPEYTGETLSPVQQLVGSSDSDAALAAAGNDNDPDRE
jgi:lambda repressor-like predicted transcriptional regulator